MYNSSILPVELQSFSYYKNKLPLFLQNSHGFIEHFQIWYDFLTTQVECSDSLLYLLDIFDENYLEYIRDLPGSEAHNPQGIFETLNNTEFPTDNIDVESSQYTEYIFRRLNEFEFGDSSSLPSFSEDYGDKCDILDKLGLIFGVRRNFSCTYIDEDDQIITEEISLNNQEFLILIKAQIIKNYCVGSYSQIKEYYDWAGLQIYMMNGPGQATLSLYLISSDEYDYSDNVKKMFLSGLLRIESVGIQYFSKIVTFGDQLKWDGFGIHEVWDVGVWAE